MLVRLAAVACVLLVIAAPAWAADPSNGSVSAETPEVSWGGEAPGVALMGPNLVLGTAGLPIVCREPFCDTYVLLVQEQADLEIESSTCANPFAEVEVVLPDGSRQFASGIDDSPRTIVDVPKAPPGSYTVHTLVNSGHAEQADYVGHARLAARLPELSIEPSRSRRSRKLNVTVTTSRPLQTVQATLARGEREVSRSPARALDNTGVLTLPLSRRLPAGEYSLQVSGTGSGHPVTTRGRVRVRRRSVSVGRNAGRAAHRAAAPRC